MTVVIPFMEMASGKTIITGDEMIAAEGNMKGASAVINLLTLGYGAGCTDDLLKLLVSEVSAEIAMGSTYVVGEKAGLPKELTMLFSMAAFMGTKSITSRYRFKAIH